jgi:DNA polymerase-3 subunit delta
MRTLKAALESGTFAPAYLFLGDDDYLKEEKVRAVIARAIEPSTRDFNLDLLRGAETDARTLATTLDALPMMAERRAVVVRDAGLLKKEARAALTRYLRQPSPETVLLLMVGAGTKADEAWCDHAVTIEFRPLTDDELGKWVVQHAAVLGVTITAAASELLATATGNDLALLAGEIDKLRSFTGDGEIDAGAVESIVGVHHGETLGDLLDRVAEANGPAAIALLERVLLQPKTTGVSVVMALTTQMLAIGWAIAARDRGLAQHRLESEFYALLKENTSSVTGRPWAEAVKAWVRGMRHWDARRVERSLGLLLATDRALKDTKVSSEAQLLTSLLLAMTTRDTRRAAA